MRVSQNLEALEPYQGNKLPYRDNLLLTVFMSSPRWVTHHSQPSLQAHAEMTDLIKVGPYS